MKAIRNITIFSLSIALLAVAPAAKADSYTIAPAPTNFSGTTLNVAQFNSSLGTLNSVDIIFTAGGTTDITASTTTSQAATISQLFTTAGAQLTDSSLGIVLTESLNGQALVNGSPIGLFNTLNLAGNSSYDSGSLTLTGNAVSDLGITSDLSAFIGSGDLDFLLAGNAVTTESYTGGNISTSQSTDVGAGVQVTYNYTPNQQPPSSTPEPGTLILFGTGLLAMAGMLRYKFMQAR
jgi:hypothetical protein